MIYKCIQHIVTIFLCLKQRLNIDNQNLITVGVRDLLTCCALLWPKAPLTESLHMNCESMSCFCSYQRLCKRTAKYTVTKLLHWDHHRISETEPMKLSEGSIFIYIISGVQNWSEHQLSVSSSWDNVLSLMKKWVLKLILLVKLT